MEQASYTVSAAGRNYLGLVTYLNKQTDFFPFWGLGSQGWGASFGEGLLFLFPYLD